MKFAVILGASNAKRLIIGLATAQKKGVKGEKGPAGSCDTPEMARRRSPHIEIHGKSTGVAEAARCDPR